MDLYLHADHAPCRAVLMTAEALGIELNHKRIDLFSYEHMTPEFLKLNPQHTIPTLVDGDFSLWESRAIMIYLVEKYGKDDSLYPKDPQKRAVVNQRLFFDMGTLYQPFIDNINARCYEQAPPNEEKLKKMHEALDFLNTFLEGDEAKYVAGDSLTIADLSLLATVSTIEATKVKLDKYPNVAKWYEKLSNEAPGAIENKDGVEGFRTLIWSCGLNDCFSYFD